MWLATDSIELSVGENWSAPAVSGDDLAFLQYTSGSTSKPKGVMVSHANLLHNEETIKQVFGQSSDSVILSWLPLYRDMGLIGGVLQPLYVGAHCVLMSPLAFLKKPMRWLNAISRFKATTSGGPNFAYDLCARNVGAGEQPPIDLSSWSVAFNGSSQSTAEHAGAFREGLRAFRIPARGFPPVLRACGSHAARVGNGR